MLGSAGIAAFMTSRISAEMGGGADAMNPEGSVTQLPAFLHEPFSAALSQALLLPAFVALFGVVAALFLRGTGEAVSPRETAGSMRCPAGEAAGSRRQWTLDPIGWSCSRRSCAGRSLARVHVDAPAPRSHGGSEYVHDSEYRDGPAYFEDSEYRDDDYSTTTTTTSSTPSTGTLPRTEHLPSTASRRRAGRSGSARSRLRRGL